MSEYTRQLDRTPFCKYSVSVWDLSIWLQLLPIKDIRLKMFHHERQPLKPTWGLLSLKYEGRAPQPSSEGQQMMKSNSCFVRIKLVESQNTTAASSCWSLQWFAWDHHSSANAQHFHRSVADLHWIGNGFLFLPLFCWHAAYKSAPRSGLASSMPLWNGKLAEMSKESGWRSWCDYCCRAEHTLESLCQKPIQFQPGRIQTDKWFQVCEEICLVVVRFALFIIIY